MCKHKKAKASQKKEWKSAQTEDLLEVQHKRKQWRVVIAITLLIIIGLILVCVSKDDEVKAGASSLVRTKEVKARCDSNQENLSFVLKELVESHPAPEIRNDLNRRILSGDIYLNFQIGVMKTHNSALLSIIDIEGVGLTKTLIINPEVLCDPAFSKEYLQLVIFHEYQHVLQLERGDMPQSALFSHNTEEPWGSAFINRWFRSEIEAYTAECELAISLGWEKFNNFCSNYKKHGLPKLKRLFVESIINSLVLSEQDKCLILELGNSP